MAELCRKCFIETWHPNAYDIEHLVMSEENDFCEGCMDCVPYVSRIDLSNLRITSTVSDFVRVVNEEVLARHNVACIDCGAVFDYDDFAYTHETGLCQYCHNPVNAVWIKR